MSSVATTSNFFTGAPKRNRHPSIHLTKKVGASTRSLPADVATTRVNIASDGSASTTALDNFQGPQKENPPLDTEDSAEGTRSPREKAAEGQESSPDAAPESHTPQAEQAGPPEESSGWFSWLYRSGPIEPSDSKGPELPETTGGPPDSSKAPSHSDPSTTTAHSDGSQRQQDQVHEEEQEYIQRDTNETTETTSTAQKRSWLQMWYGSDSTTKHQEPTGQPSTESNTPTPAEPETTAPRDVNMAPKGPPDEPGDTAGLSRTPGGTAKSSGWSFWAKDPPKDATPENPQEVEAVEASLDPNSPSRLASHEPNPTANVNITKKDSVKSTLPRDNCAKDGSFSTTEAIPASTLPSEPRPADVSASKHLQRILPNQVLPCFEDTYHLEESPSIFQSLGRLLHYNKGPEHNHVSRVRDPPRIKRALAIGVHGYFPAPLIRSVLGQPTGTSIRFSNMAAESIHKWTTNHGYSCDVEKIALEGEGRITERVDLLWKLLLNWMDEIRKADFIMIACHSQGVPVSIMLVAKLISFGCVNASRVGICAMAGVNMGPFSSYRSRWISGSAGELFDFELPFSKVSKDHEAALKCVLDFGVRISYIGSIDDQLVSLEVSHLIPLQRSTVPNAPVVFTVFSNRPPIHLPFCFRRWASSCAKLVSTLS